MGKNDGVQIFELFRNGSPKSADTGPVVGPTMPEKTQLIRNQPRPIPPAAPPPKAVAPPNMKVAEGPAAATGDTVVSMKLNTALFGLMVGAGCLFGSFALGVQYERRQHAGDPPAAVASEGPVVAEEKPKPAPPQPVRRETAPPVRREEAPAVREERPAAPAEPRKGWTIQLMAYPEASRNLAETMTKKIRDAGGDEVTLTKIGDEYRVLAGFVEKQTSPEAEALQKKYKRIKSDLGATALRLDWLQQTR